MTAILYRRNVGMSKTDISLKSERASQIANDYVVIDPLLYAVINRFVPLPQRQ